MGIMALISLYKVATGAKRFKCLILGEGAMCAEKTFLPIIWFRDLCLNFGFAIMYSWAITF